MRKSTILMTATIPTMAVRATLRAVNTSKTSLRMTPRRMMVVDQKAASQKGMRVVKKEMVRRIRSNTRRMKQVSQKLVHHRQQVLSIKL